MIEEKLNLTSNKLSFGFVLLPRFTMSPFATFIDALRLAADDGDKSRQVNCSWTVMSHSLDPITSSCGVKVVPSETFREPSEFDYIVVVGGLLDNKKTTSSAITRFISQANNKNVKIIGVCTGSFALIDAGIMEGKKICISWFHYKDLINYAKNITPVVDQLYVVDGNTITCPGGTICADLAASIIEEHMGTDIARKSLRILGIDQLRPANTPQAQPVLDDNKIENKWVIKSVLLMEQNLSSPLPSDELAKANNISRRQLERLFMQDTGLSIQQYYRKIRLHFGLWLLINSKKTVTEIAQDCGFSDTTHFTKVFKSNYNILPTQVRHLDTLQD